MTPIIVAYREVLYYKQIPEIFTLCHAAVLGVIILIIGSLVFQSYKEILRRNYRLNSEVVIEVKNIRKKFKVYLIRDMG